MDGFHLAQVELVRLGRAGRKGAPDTFDAAGYVALLQRLRVSAATRSSTRPSSAARSRSRSPARSRCRRETPLVITEGNYLLLDDGPWAGVRPLLDECWYVDVDDDLRADRLVARHVQFGRSDADARRWVEITDEPNARRIAATRGRATHVVTSFPPPGVDQPAEA